MGLIRVNGVSGTGKSTLRLELVRRGYEAYDSDEDGISSFYDDVSGERVAIEGELPEGFTIGRSWKISRPRVEEIAIKAREKLIFLCGSSTNEPEVWDLFSKVICLVIDEPTLRYRVETRTTGNNFGKDPRELADILRWNEFVEEMYRELGATIVDASRSTEDVADDVVRIARSLGD